MFKKNGRIHLNMDGPDGNLFSLLSLADTLSRSVGMSKEMFDDIYKSMTEHDYTHAVHTLIDHFGDFIHLEGFVDNRIKVSTEKASIWF